MQDFYQIELSNTDHEKKNSEVTEVKWMLFGLIKTLRTESWWLNAEC